MMSRHESALVPMEILNADNAGSKSRGIFHLKYNALYTAATEELSLLIIAESNFEKNLIKPDLFHAPTFHTSVKVFLGELRAVFVVQRKESVSESVAFLNKPMLHTRATSISLL